MGDSALQSKGNAVFQTALADAVDFTSAIGQLLVFSAGTPAVNSSSSVISTAIVLDCRKRVVAGNTYYDNVIGILGGLRGAYRAKIGTTAALKFGDSLMQDTAGNLIKDAGTGTRVVCGVLAETDAVTGDLASVVLFAPQTRS